MNFEEVGAIAKPHTINPGNISKAELFKSIQVNDGSFTSIGTAHGGGCDQLDCIWRENCAAASPR